MCGRFSSLIVLVCILYLLRVISDFFFLKMALRDIFASLAILLTMHEGKINMSRYPGKFVIV